MRPENSSPTPTWPASGTSSRDDDELGVATGETHLDAARVELAADLESGLAEQVEQMEVERRCERLAHAASELGGLLVAATRQPLPAPAGSPGHDCRAAS